ncbi:MAG: hypothetical protein JWS10_3778 [Cypionkella sp.]|nr:hypothetical protein [Cypionkella sp.]
MGLMSSRTGAVVWDVFDMADAPGARGRRVRSFVWHLGGSYQIISRNCTPQVSRRDPNEIVAMRCVGRMDTSPTERSASPFILRYHRLSPPGHGRKRGGEPLAIVLPDDVEHTRVICSLTYSIGKYPKRETAGWCSVPQ